METIHTTLRLPRDLYDLVKDEPNMSQHIIQCVRSYHEEKSVRIETIENELETLQQLQSIITDKIENLEKEKEKILSQIRSDKDDVDYESILERLDNIYKNKGYLPEHNITTIAYNHKLTPLQLKTWIKENTPYYMEE